MSKLELIEAVKRDDLDGVKALVEEKELINQEDEYGWTALNWAAGKGQLEIVKLLLDHGADPFKTGRDQRTPYQIALAAGHVEVCRLLREAEEEVGGGNLSQSAREFCIAYSLRDLRQFPGWPVSPHQAVSQEARSNEAGGNGGAVEEDEEVAFLHPDLTVTKSMWHGEDVIFDQVTPEWEQFCTNTLNFKVADDLDLISRP